MTKQNYKFSIEVLGTQVQIILYNKNQNIIDLCFNELKRIEKKFSRFDDKSFLNKLNSKLNYWQKTDAETLNLIKKSLELNKQTNGFFDITLKSNLEDLGYDKNYSFEKKDSKISKCNFISKFLSPIKINNNQIYLRKEIEFGGLGKGYALDQLNNILTKNKVKNYLINAGGDIICKSSKSNSWKIHLEHPDKEDTLIGEINLETGALASSSPKHRNWKNLHHLINPKTQNPQNNIKSIFVQTKKGIDADSYATSLFVSGFENAIKLSKKLNLNVLIVSKENQMYVSPNFEVNLYK